MGEVKGRRVLVLCKKSFSTPSTVVPFMAAVIGFRFTSSLPSKQRACGDSRFSVFREQLSLGGNLRLGLR